MEEYLSQTFCQGENGKHVMCDVLCNLIFVMYIPYKNFLYVNAVPKDVLTLMIRDTSLIPDERLSLEIKQVRACLSLGDNFVCTSDSCPVGLMYIILIVVIVVHYK